MFFTSFPAIFHPSVDPWKSRLHPYRIGQRYFRVELQWTTFLQIPFTHMSNLFPLACSFFLHSPVTGPFSFSLLSPATWRRTGCIASNTPGANHVPWRVLSPGDNEGGPIFAKLFLAEATRWQTQGMCWNSTVRRTSTILQKLSQ